MGFFDVFKKAIEIGAPLLNAKTLGAGFAGFAVAVPVVAVAASAATDDASSAK